MDLKNIKKVKHIKMATSIITAVICLTLSTGVVLAAGDTSTVSAGAEKALDIKQAAQKINQADKEIKEKTVSSNSILNKESIADKLNIETANTESKLEIPILGNQKKLNEVEADKKEDTANKTAKQEEKQKEATEIKEKTEAAEGLIMADVEDALNIREDPSEEAELAGKLYNDCVGEIIEERSGWTKIKSGDLEGWAKSEFLIHGEKVEKLAEEASSLVAIVNSDALRVRVEPSETAEIDGVLLQGDEVVALEDMGKWVSVESKSGTGYIAKEFVNLNKVYVEGETIQTIIEREKEIQRQAEEERKAAEAKAKKEAEAVRKKSPKASNNGAASTNANDLTLLAALIQCEAGGESYEGKVSVGAVVMNRVRSSQYGSSVQSVVFAPGQFTPAGNGKVAGTLAAGPSASCIQAASDALNGASYVGSATQFRNIRSGRLGIVIGNHVFW